MIVHIILKRFWKFITVKELPLIVPRKYVYKTEHKCEVAT